jgi:hypothetical protein
MELKDFLVKSKVGTYASDGEGKEKILEDGSKELVYESGEWKYRDRYFGFNQFIGEEIVWLNNEAVWGMNYYGRIFSDKVNGKQLYEFLRKALRSVKSERPFRGPKEFQEKEWNYKDESIGTVNNFEGVETIYFREEKVYELNYHGGTLAKKIFFGKG